MENDLYYFKGNDSHFASVSHLCQCNKCKRKILVSMGVNGVPHHFGTNVTCADCLEIKEEFKQEYSDFVKRIEDWKAEKS